MSVPPAPLLALVAVFAIKLTVVLQFADHPLIQGDAGLDTTLYVDLARRVLAGDVSLGPGLYFVSPLYIYFTAAVLSIGDSLVAVRAVQAALGTAAVGFVFVATHAWFGRRAAWYAAALAAGTGLFTFYETLVLQAALDPFLTAAFLAALALALRGESAGWLPVAGMLIGLQSLNRPNMLLVAAGLGILLLLMRRWRSALLLSAGIAAALAPLLWRNAVVSGEWSLVSSHGGLNFYIGNHPGADGTYRRIPGITPNMAGQQMDARRIAEAAAARPLSDSEVSAHFYREGWQWITDHPLDAAALFGRKLLYILSARHLWLNYSYPFFARDNTSLLGVLLVGPWMLVPMGIVGLLLPVFRPRTPEPGAGYFVWVAFVPLYAVSVAIFFVAERYRLPLLIPFCIGSGALVAAAVRARDNRAWRALRGPALAVAALALAVNWPRPLDDGRAEQRLRMAERLIARGETAKGEQWASRALKLHPEPGLVHLRVGRSLRAHRHLDRAIAHLEQAVNAAPGQPEPVYALGQALVDAERHREAIPHLRAAVEAGVRLDLAGYDLARSLAAVGDRAEAVRVLAEVRPARSDDAASWHALGQLAQQLNAPELAAGFYQEGARAAPTAPDLHKQLGLMRVLSGDFAGAVTAFEAATTLAPQDPSLHLNLAVALAALGRTGAAKASAGEALRLDPSYTRAREFLSALGR